MVIWPYMGIIHASWCLRLDPTLTSSVFISVSVCVCVSLFLFLTIALNSTIILALTMTVGATRYIYHELCPYMVMWSCIISTYGHTTMPDPWPGLRRGNMLLDACNLANISWAREAPHPSHVHDTVNMHIMRCWHSKYITLISLTLAWREGRMTIYVYNAWSYDHIWVYCTIIGDHI